MTIYLGDTDNTYTVPLAWNDVVDAQGGTDTLVLNWSSASGPRRRRRSSSCRGFSTPKSRTTPTSWG